MTATHSLPAAASLEQILELAINHHQAGRLPEAEALYQSILQAEPAHPDANHNMGVLAVARGQAPVALPYFEAALAASPEQPQHWLGYLETLILTGQVELARQVLALAQQHGLEGAPVERLARQLEAAVQQQPEASAVQPGSETSAGLPSKQEIDTLMALYGQGRLGEVVPLARALTLRFPGYGFGWKMLGHVQLRQGLPEDALVSMQHAARQLPEDAEVHFNLGNIFLNLGRQAEAEASFRRTLEIRPGYADAHNNLGTLLKDQSRVEEARACFQTALALEPDHVDAHNNQGNIFKELGQLDEAENCFRRAISIAPNYALAYSNLGTVREKQAKLDEAMEFHRTALSLGPDVAEIHYNLATTLCALGEVKTGVEFFRSALKINNRMQAARDNLIFFMDMLAEANTATLQNERKIWNAIHAAPLMTSRGHANDPNPERRLHLGYVSADFYGHSATSSFTMMLEKYDRSHFEVFAYSNSNKVDDTTRLFQANATAWRNIVGLSDEAVADLIRKDGIDILIDLSGHTFGNRLLAFARKPAPIQISAWGSGTGTGMAAMDVLFSDRVVIPPEERKFYTEDVRYLPCLGGYSEKKDFPDVQPLPALATGAITFGSFNRLVKLSDDTLTLWAGILSALPQSKLIFKAAQLDDHGARNRLMRHFEQAGIDPQRITILGKTSWFEHLQSHGSVDIALDPMPHGGGITTLESIRMGVPVITLRWPTLVGRVSASVLTSLGLTDWIAENPEQYVDIAVKKARDIQALASLRSHLRHTFSSSIFGNQEAYVQAAEDEYRKLWREWCARQPGR